MRKTLAIDPGTKLGFAVGDEPAAIFFGSMDLSKIDDHGERFQAFYSRLNALIDDTEPRKVLVEKLPLVLGKGRSNIGAIVYLQKLVAIVQLVTSQRHLPLGHVTPGEANYWFLGTKKRIKRDLRKRLLVEEAERRGYRVNGDDNIADALAIWHTEAKQFKLHLTT